MQCGVVCNEMQWMYTTMHIHTHTHVCAYSYMFFKPIWLYAFFVQIKNKHLCVYLLQYMCIYIYIHTCHLIFAAQVALVEEAIRQRFSEDPRILLRRLGEKRPPSQEVAAKERWRWRRLVRMTKIELIEVSHSDGGDWMSVRWLKSRTVMKMKGCQDRTCEKKRLRSRGCRKLDGGESRGWGILIERA